MENQLDRAYRTAFQQLEDWDFIEPDEGRNGENGYVVLTDKAIQAKSDVDFEALHQRRLLLLIREDPQYS